MKPAWRVLAVTAILAVCVAFSWRGVVASDPRATTGDSGITMVTAEWCGYCRAQQALFEQAGVRYRSIDADELEGQLAMLALGARGVPVTVIGQDVIRGYDVERLRELLQPLGYQIPAAR